jgi:hypothetical protein
LVEVVRLSPTGGGWITVTGDLETPGTIFEKFDNKKGVVWNSPLYTPVAPVGVRIGQWEGENFGPIFADVSFFKPHMMDPVSSSIPDVAIHFSDQSSTDNSSGGDVLGDWSSLSGSSSSFSSLNGTLSGNIPGSVSGEINGTTGGSVDIVLSGQLDTVSSVPLPDAEWLFTTGLVGWIVLVNHRRWARRLGRIRQSS